jgi:hypothetical protein
MRLYRALTDGAQFAVKALAFAAIVGGFGACSILYATAAHEARTAREMKCRAHLAELTAHNLFVERYVRPADPCLALAVVRGGE